MHVLHVSEYNLNHYVATHELSDDSRAELIHRPESLHLSERNLNHHVTTRELCNDSRAELIHRQEL